MVWFDPFPPALSVGIWQTEGAADPAGEAVLDLRVAGNGFNHAVGWVRPEGMGCSLSLEVTAVAAQMFKQALALHGIATVSWIASFGSPRSASSRRSSKMS